MRSCGGHDPCIKRCTGSECKIRKACEMWMVMDGETTNSQKKPIVSKLDERWYRGKASIRGVLDGIQGVVAFLSLEMA